MLDITFSLKGLKTIIFKTTNTRQLVEFFHSLIFAISVPKSNRNQKRRRKICIGRVGNFYLD